MDEQPQFKVFKILNVGTNSTYLNRIFSQFSELLQNNFFKLSSQVVDEIKEQLFECAKDFIRADEYIKKYLEIENSSLDKILKGSIKIHNNSISYDDPTNELLKNFRIFLLGLFLF